jgi:hypothetical protein
MNRGETTEELPLEVVHIAGAPVAIGPLVRQLCGWCGYRLVDVDQRRMAVPAGQEGAPATWEYGDLVGVRGPMSRVIEHVDGAPLPLSACSFESLMPPAAPDPEPRCAGCSCCTAATCRARECDISTCPG